MKNRLYFIPAFAITIILLIVGTFCDLGINTAIYWHDNGLSHFLASIAVVPFGIAFGFMAGSTFKMFKGKPFAKQYQNILLLIFSIALFLFGTYYTGQEIISVHAYNLEAISKWLCIPFGLIVIIPSAILGYILYEKMNHEHLIRNYIFIIATIVVTVLLIQGMKAILPRMRYVAVRIEGAEHYRPWYLPDFNLTEWIKGTTYSTDKIKSFPSGHSNIAITAAFILMFIPILFPDKVKIKQVVLFYIGFAYFLLIAFSRMLIGAHYLSDTMFAGLLCLSIYFIANEIYLRKLSN